MKKLNRAANDVNHENGNEAATVVADWESVKLSGPQMIRDLWRQKDLGVFEKEFSATVALTRGRAGKNPAGTVALTRGFLVAPRRASNDNPAGNGVCRPNGKTA